MHRIASVADTSRFLKREQKMMLATCMSLLANPSVFHALRRKSPRFADSSRSYASDVDEQIAVNNLIASFQSRGHHLAKLDPLQLTPYVERLPYAFPKEIPLNHYGQELLSTVKKMKSEMNQDKVYKLPPTTNIGGSEASLKLKDIIARLERIYCGSIAYEYMHLNSRTQVEWVRKRIESPNAISTTADQKKRILQRLVHATGFENFIARKYPSVKRFGLEGADMFIPAMNQMVDTFSEFGGKIFNIAIAHRGRINCLANVCGVTLSNIYMNFLPLEADNLGIGDMKYHLGATVERVNEATNKKVLVSVSSNPSHLEGTGCVTMGKTRAQQFYAGDKTGAQVIAVIVHGNQAISGQGIAYETAQLGDLPSYTSYGTMHIVVNNQLGFTADDLDGRSSPYCTDVGVAMNSPVFHVNADDPEAVIFVTRLAMEFRHAFRKDPYIDLFGYRKFGHSETDEPMFTQPVMYHKIKAMTPVLDMYAEKLKKEGVVTSDETKRLIDEYDKKCEEGFCAAAKEKTMRMGDWLEVVWPNFGKGKDMKKCEPTGAKETVLMDIGKKFSSPPPVPNFVIFTGLERILSVRQKMLAKKEVDFAVAEAMAFGSMLLEGVHIRLTGEDSPRATFSHRHHVVHHQTAPNTSYCVLDNLSPKQARYTVYNSPLSEYSVMGFELGYSTADPNSLCIWEAQFGDFSNTAQVMIDQFVSSGEAKWLRQSGLVLLLPHGLEGHGSEHSSCRPERFIQMSTDDPVDLPGAGATFAMEQLRAVNWIVAYCTTPANYFHILRRQVKMPFRKPLVVFAAKSILRLPAARSPISDMTEKSEFKRLISDPVDPAGVKKVVFCCGKVYYDLKSGRAARKLDKEVALVRIEQIAPFPYDLIKAECAKYPKAKLGFVQEEHKNQGFWSFVDPRFRSILGSREVKLIASRSTSAAPSVGSSLVHGKELKKLVADCFSA